LHNTLKKLQLFYAIHLHSTIVETIFQALGFVLMAITQRITQDPLDIWQADTDSIAICNIATVCMKARQYLQSRPCSSFQC